MLNRVIGYNVQVINYGYDGVAFHVGRSTKLMKPSAEYQNDDERVDADIYDDINESFRIEDNIMNVYHH